MELDPQARAVLDIMSQAEGPKLNEVPPEGARQMFKALLEMVDLGEVPIGKVEEFGVPGPAGDIPVRLYTPVAAASDVLPVLVYYHGGGWVIGDLDSADALCRTLANESGAKVVSVDYRLAPEHPFPAAVEDAFAAVAWVEKNAGKIGVDANRIAVAGDSAGGNLAAVVSQKAKAEKAPHIAFQMLIYPATDVTADTPSRREWASGYFLEVETMDWFFNHYLGSHDATDPRVSPLKAASFAGLPPAYIITAGFDVLRDEGRAYAEALKSAGVAVEYVNYDSMIHGFFNMQKAFDVARAAVKTAAGKLRDALS